MKGFTLRLKWFSPGLVATATFLILAGLAGWYGLPHACGEWWNANITSYAYRGPDASVPSEWWALPARIGRFFAEAVPIGIAGGIASCVYLILEEQFVPDEK